MDLFQRAVLRWGMQALNFCAFLPPRTSALVEMNFFSAGGLACNFFCDSNEK